MVRLSISKHIKRFAYYSALTLLVFSSIQQYIAPARAISECDKVAVERGSLFADNDQCKNICDSNNAPAASGGVIDRYMQAVASHESHGDPKANSGNGAYGKYQNTPAGWSFLQSFYPAAKQYSRADLAPEEVQDAAEYLSVVSQLKKYNGDLTKVIVDQYLPVANDNLDSWWDKVPAGGNSQTIGQFVTDIINRINSGEGSNITLKYSQAPGFQDALNAAGGAPTNITTSRGGTITSSAPTTDNSSPPNNSSDSSTTPNSDNSSANTDSSSSGTPGPTSCTCSVQGAGNGIDLDLPTIGDNGKVADAINKFIAKYNGSPFSGMGQKFVDAGIAHQVNPLFEVAIAAQESGMGNQIPSGSFNSFGRTAAPGQPSVSANGRNWYKYDSFEQSIDGQAGFLGDEYLRKRNLHTPEDTATVYAPPSDGNNTAQYIQNITGWMQEMINDSSGAISGGVNGGGATQSNCNTDSTDSNGVSADPSSGIIVKPQLGMTNPTFKPTAIIIHWTGGSTSPDQTVAALKSNPSCPAGGCGVQLTIDPTGNVYQLTPYLNTQVAHARCANGYAIGIELEEGATDTPGAISEIGNNQTQFNALIKTIKYLQQTFNIPTKGDLSADGNSGTGVHTHKQVDHLDNGQPRCQPPQDKQDVDDAYWLRVIQALGS